MNPDLRRLGGIACALGALMLATSPASAQADGRDPHGPGAAAEGDDAEPSDPHAGMGGNPHAGGGGRGQSMFDVPEDGSIEDPSVPVGSIAAVIADAAGKPLPNTSVTLGMLFNSVAKGESRKRVAGTTDARGLVKFDGLEIGSGVAYRVSVSNDGATFALPPFQLSAKAGTRGILHVYPVVRDVTQTLVVSQSVIYAEVKDDRIQIQQAFTIYNVGKNAWIPNDLVIPLPEKFTAFTSQQGMSDVGLDAVPNKGARLRGTISPGQHVIEFRWQLPYAGESEVRLDVGMPPHLAAARVIAPASKGMTLDVPGFPQPEPTSDGQGQRALVTQKQLKREEAALKSVAVVIKGLPTEGPGKIIATLLAAGGLAAGIMLGTRKPVSRDRHAERARLLRELEELERAKLREEIGPKTYERARRELLDEVARTFADDSRSASDPTQVAKVSKRKRSTATA